MKASEPKWVNFLSNIIGVNSLMLEGLQLSHVTSINKLTMIGGLQS